MNRNWSCSHNDSALRNRWLATAVGIPGLRSPMVSLPPGKNGDVAQRSFSADGAWKQCRVPLQLCGRIGLSAAHDARRVLSQVCTLIPGKRFKRARFVVAMATVSPGWRAGVAWPARMASASRASGDDVGMPDNKRVGNRSCPPSGELPPRILRSGSEVSPGSVRPRRSPRRVRDLTLAETGCSAKDSVICTTHERITRMARDHQPHREGGERTCRQAPPLSRS